MSHEEFLVWADEDTLAEWMDGEVIMTSPASKPHQDLAGFLGSVLPTFVEQRELGLTLAVPFQMKVVPGFWLRISWLWQHPLPRVLDALRDLGVV